MALYKTKPPSSKVECVACKKTTSLTLAYKEGWHGVVPSIHPTDADRRTHIAWCPECVTKYKVTD